MSKKIQLAQEFARMLSAELDPETLKIVIERNATPKYAGCCASHDFTDPNEIMAEAFEAVYKRLPDVREDEDIDRWNEAWDMAKNHNFNAEAIL
jgi:hypothetical protein